MARQWAGRIALGIMAVGLYMGAGKAHARAAITDFEASKLTFDALTATPVYHRPVVHFVRHSASHSMAWSGHRAVIRNVAYRPHASVARAAHRHTRSRRT